MRLVVGLGNPGKEYARTKHNVGFMVVDELASRWGQVQWKEKFHSLAGEYIHPAAGKIMLLKPLTYMNNSGEAVSEVIRFYKLELSDMVVLFDDMDLPLGRLRLREKGGTGGHRGMESILNHLSQGNFHRIRIGIGRPPVGWDVVRHVLSVFAPTEWTQMQETLNKAADAVEYAMQHPFDKTMNQFNV